MFEPIWIADACRLIRAGELTPTDLVQRCLRQISEYEDRVRAWVVVDEVGAREAASRLTEAAVGGDFLGPLHGIPVAIKDIVDVKGFPTRAGSPLRQHHVAGSDAPLVTALRRAGAIILGKTVTCQFACFDPSPTRNPWHPDLQHTPGGSSSGSAVAVAMGMCLGAIGTQTGGSLVRPASYCGISACKPTLGIVPSQGVVPVSRHLDHPGPMARTAEDLQYMLRCLATPAGDRRLCLKNPNCDGAPPQLGLMGDFFMKEADETIRQATEAAVDKLGEAGAEIQRVPLPDGFSDVHLMHRRIMAVDAAVYHRQQFESRRKDYGPCISGLLDEGLATRAVDYAEALAHRRKFRIEVEAIFDDARRLDALIMPATDTTAPNLDTTGSPRFQSPWSHAGVPVVSIPSQVASDGMPAAVQLVGRYGDDFGLLRVARWCERHLGFDGLPPLLDLT